ncbi:MAG: TIGR04076 family protein [Firmicutes bacterium]|nr:TIGR04076 family protein [Bacillota bacterium]
MANIPRYEIKVTKVNGGCKCGYKEGDVFYATGLKTPDVAFCGNAYRAISHAQVALHWGAQIPGEAPGTKTNMTCPDNGIVTFSITKLQD